jgi:FkbM family methyltransferase
MSIIKFIKKIILLLIYFTGYKIIGNKKIIKHNNFDAIIDFCLNFSKRKVIFFDVGANLGQSIDRFKTIRNKSIIHSFEPTPNLYQIILEKYKNTKNVFINNFALGNKTGNLFFNSYKYHKVNSFISMKKKSKFKMSRMLVTKTNKNNFEDKIKVKVETIDNYCKKNNIKTINLLKIDTQGFEDKVLGGAKQMLNYNRIEIIELELILGFAYEKTLSFFDIEKYLNKYKYKLISIKNFGNIISFSNYQTDLIYVNDKLFKKIEKLHEKNIEIKNVMNSVSLKNPFSY